VDASPRLDLEERDPHTGQLVHPRTVLGRDPSTDPPRPVVAVTFVPETGEVILARSQVEDELEVGAEAVLRRLRDPGMPWVVATDDPAALWTFLADHGGDANYRARGTIREERAMLATGRLSSRPMLRASFAGFKWGKMAERLVLDPQGFSDQSPAQLLGLGRIARLDPIARVLALRAWGLDVVSWCADAGLRMRAGRGGIAAQLLTDTRFWPAARRKVPKMLNALARPHLPGNHYQLLQGGAGRHERATELDLTSAHHHAAREVRFTDPNDLHIRGWMVEAIPEDRQTIGFYPGTAAFAQLRNGVGLLRVELEAPAELPELVHPAMPPAGTTSIRYVWTEELDGLEADGARVLRIVGGLTSDGSADHLNRYAAWALEQRAAAGPARSRWLKPLLLSVYGVMAQGAKPPASFSWHPTPKGNPEVVILGGAPVDAYVARQERSYEPPYANVCDRGLIEAHVRDSVLAMARALQGAQDAMEEDEGPEHLQVLAVRADAVLVGGERGQQLLQLAEAHATAGRPLRGLWHHSGLTNLELESATHYRSDQQDRLPGVPRAGRARGDP
jgi:hypothetical protein